MPKTKRTLWRLTIGAFYAFFIFGFADNMKGATIPALLSDLHLSYSQGGTILLGAYIGFLIATLLTGILADLAGKKAVIFVAGAALLIGIAGYSTFSSFWLLMAAMLVLGVGIGSIELGGNAMIVELHGADRGRFLNLLAVFHGLGSMVAPFYAGQMLADGASWRLVYRLALIPVVLLPAYFLFLRYPHQRQAPRANGGLQKVWRSAVSSEMACFYLLIGAYCAAEIGIGSWIVEFLQKAKGQSVIASSLYLSLYFGLIMLGRLLGSFVVERAGYFRIMLLAASASILCLTLGVFGPPALAPLVPLTGLFFSVIFPTTTAAVSGRHQENVGTLLGLLFTFAGIGGMVGPWMVGVAGDALGIQPGFGTLISMCVLMVAALTALTRLTAQRKAGAPSERQPAICETSVAE